MIKRFFFLSTSAIVVSAVTIAQKQASTKRDTSFVVEAGVIINEVIPFRHMFHYAAYVEGKVFFRDGNVREARMNYNRLMDEMDFIALKGDTLAVDNEPTIKFIAIGRDTFYYDHGYIMLLSANNGLKLGVKEGFKQGDRRKETGYEMMSSASSVSSLSSWDDGKRMHQLKVREQIVISTFTEYFIADKFNHFILFTEKNLMNQFPRCTSALQKYIRKNRIDFSRRRDIDRLMSFTANACIN